MNPNEAPPPAPSPRQPAQPSASVQSPVPKRSRWKGSVVAIALMALVGGGAWYLVQPSPPAGPGAGGPGAPGAPRGAGGPGGPGAMRGGATVTVGVATARMHALPTVLDALGTVTPVSTVTVRPQVSGLLTQVLFTEGQTVKKGQVLAQIDPRPFEQALMQARGARLKDEAQLENARLTLARYRTLLAQDSIARQDVDTQAALVKQLEGTVVSDKAQEASAQISLNDTRVTAPAAGRIGLRAVDAGNYVSTGDASGLAVITQMAPIDVQFSIPQDRVADILAAQKGPGTSTGAGADLTVTALDRARSGTVGTGQFSTLDNQVDVATGTVKAKARFANADGAMFPNQFVNVQLMLANVPTIVVPVTAVRTGAKGDFVWVIREDRTVTMRSITRGQATVEFTAIATGLKAGERVVTEGGDRLQEGMAVQLPGAPSAAPGGATPGARGTRGGRGPRGGGPQETAPVAEGVGAPSAAQLEPAASAASPAAAAASAPADAVQRGPRPAQNNP